MANLIDKILSEAQNLVQVLTVADKTAADRYKDLCTRCFRLSSMFRFGNLPGSSPASVFVLVDTQVLGNGLRAPVMMHNEDGLLPAFPTREQAEEQAKELNLEIMELPIV